jgi:hypothetical protein
MSCVQLFTNVLHTDVPTGRLLSWFGVAEAATSVTVSHNGEYLATSHVDSLGICLWVNRTLYANVSVNAVSPGISTLFYSSQLVLMVLGCRGACSRATAGAAPYVWVC